MRANCRLSRRKSIYLRDLSIRPSMPHLDRLFQKDFRKEPLALAGAYIAGCHFIASECSSELRIEPLALASFEPDWGLKIRRGKGPFSPGYGIRNSRKYWFWNPGAKTIKFVALSNCSLEPATIKCSSGSGCQATHGDLSGRSGCVGNQPKSRLVTAVFSVIPAARVPVSRPAGTGVFLTPGPVGKPERVSTGVPTACD
jgi:hypothetical protein